MPPRSQRFNGVEGFLDARKRKCKKTTKETYNVLVRTPGVLPKDSAASQGLQDSINHNTRLECISSYALEAYVFRGIL